MQTILSENPHCILYGSLLLCINICLLSLGRPICTTHIRGRLNKNYTNISYYIKRYHFISGHFPFQFTFSISMLWFRSRMNSGQFPSVSLIYSAFNLKNIRLRKMKNILILSIDHNLFNKFNYKVHFVTIFWFIQILIIIIIQTCFIDNLTILVCFVFRFI